MPRGPPGDLELRVSGLVAVLHPVPVLEPDPAARIDQHRPEGIVTVLEGLAGEPDTPAQVLQVGFGDGHGDIVGVQCKAGRVAYVWRVSATIALLPSPLLGSVVWDDVAAGLEAAGWRCLVVDLPRVIVSPTDVRDHFTRTLHHERELILVPHSNAGLYAPALADSLRSRATVFVDAALPTASSTTPLAPPAFLEFLTELADEQGMLPPWTRWWGTDADLDALFPSAQWRQRVQAGESRLPLSYFRATLAVPAGWTAGPCAYLGFGTTYAEELAAARQYGWPVEVLEGSHLHMLHQPVSVASSLMELVRKLERGEEQPHDHRHRHRDGEAPHF